MSVTKVIDAQSALFREMETTFATPPKPDAAGSVADEVIKAQAAQIEARIARLQQARDASTSRYEAALAAERAALEALLRSRPATPDPRQPTQNPRQRPPAPGPTPTPARPEAGPEAGAEVSPDTRPRKSKRQKQ